MNEKEGVDLFVDITTYQMMNPRPLFESAGLEM